MDPLWRILCDGPFKADSFQLICFAESSPIDPLSCILCDELLITYSFCWILSNGYFVVDLCDGSFVMDPFWWILCDWSFVIDPLWLILCYWSFGMDPLWWILWDGSFGMDPLGWILCDGSSMIDPFHWIFSNGSFRLIFSI